MIHLIVRKPSDDPKADKLINSNLNHPEEQYSTLPDNQNESATNQENEQSSGEMTPERAQTIFESLDETQQQAMYVIIGEILNDKEES